MITTLPNEVISIITAHLDMRSFYRLWRTSKHLSLVLNFEAPVDTLLNRAPLVVQTKYHWRPRGPVTPKQLNTAIERGLCRLLDRLLSKGWIDSAEVLLTAIQFKQLEVVELLYHYHPNLDPSGYRGGPLHWACHVNALEICEYLLSRGTNVNQRSSTLSTPLHLCTDPVVAQLLIDHGSLLDARDSKQRTPLHLACSKSLPELAQLLVDRGADMDARDHRSWAPLHYAAAEGSLEIVEMLMTSGARIKTSGTTPVQLARIHGHEPVVQLFISLC